MRVAEDRGNRQASAKRLGEGAGRGTLGRQQRRRPNAQRQSRGKRAAAQGAEESSAPQARCV